MRHTLMISVAALALAAGSSSLSLAQQKNSGPTGMNPPAGTNAPAANPSGTPGAAEAQPSESPAPGTKRAQDRAPEKQKSTQQAPANGKQAPVQQGQAQPGATKNNAATEQRGGTKEGANENERSGTKQGANERPMASKNVSLTTEQKTTIRSKVLTSSAPRVTNVNFDIKVGVVVPRTVRIVPLPAVLVEIEPTWRGYMYFVRGDEIIVVEPGTLRIVAVLDV